MADESTPIDELIVNPEVDFKDLVIPPGWYDAAIGFAQAKVKPNDDQFNPGMTEVTVGYRLEVPPNDDGTPSEYHGQMIRGFGPNMSMLTNQGKNFGWKKWLEVMGMQVERSAPAYSVKPSDFQGMAVRVRLGTKQIKTKEGPRTTNTVEVVVRRDGLATDTTS